jgi:hypothetical protein
LVQLYETIIDNFWSTKGWSVDINYNIRVKQGFSLSHTLFGIYIDKLEDCLEVVGCVGLTLASIVIILLVYVDDIVLMKRNPYEFSKQPRILKEFFCRTRMMLNIDKTKVMIIISPNISYDSFIYDNNSLEGVPLYNYIGIGIDQKLN